MSKRLNDYLAMVWNWGDFIAEGTSPRIVNTGTDEQVCKLIGHCNGAHLASHNQSESFP